MKTQTKNLKDVIQALGGYEKAATAMGEDNYQTVQDWVKKGRVPANKVVAVHKKTQIPLSILNPDLYGAHVIQTETQPHTI